MGKFQVVTNSNKLTIVKTKALDNDYKIKKKKEKKKRVLSGEREEKCVDEKGW